MNTSKGLVAVGVLLPLTIAGCGGGRNQIGPTALKAQQEAEHSKHDTRMELGGHVHDTWMEFRTQPKQVKAGEQAIWTMNIWQAGKPAKRNNWVREFKMVHDKLMHLIVVSKDLSYFNHVHPEPKGNGLFIIEQTLPRGGDFKVYADYTPMNGEQEVAQHEFKVAGAAPAPVKLVPDV